MTLRLTTRVRRETRAARLLDVTCTLGRRDRPYPEEYGAWTIALVRRGRFTYRGSDVSGTHDLREGWLLVGRPSQAYECGHDHDGGDECTALLVSDRIVADVAGAIRSHDTPLFHGWSAPIPRVAALLEKTRAAGEIDLDEVAYRVVEAVATLGQRAPSKDASGRVHRARIDEAIQAIETSSHGPVSLAELAAQSGLSPYHFLRVFSRVTGTTPHQYLIGARLRRAALLLLETSRPITSIAYDVGFQDLSNFVRTFHRAIGCSPRAYRRHGPPSREVRHGERSLEHGPNRSGWE